MQINITDDKFVFTWAQGSSSAEAGASSSDIEYYRQPKYQYQWPKICVERLQRASKDNLYND
jgi:hypothetical protein